MTVRYRSATLGEFIEHHSYDVSRGGMFIKTPSPFPPGTLLKFQVRIADEQRVLQGVGRVVWKREKKNDHPNGPAGMGIKFIKIDEASQGLIEQLVENRGEDEESEFENPPSEDSTLTQEPLMFPEEQGELPAPEDQTVIKSAAELLDDALRASQEEGEEGVTTSASLPRSDKKLEASEEVDEPAASEGVVGQTADKQASPVRAGVAQDQVSLDPRTQSSANRSSVAPLFVALGAVILVGAGIVFFKESDSDAPSARGEREDAAVPPEQMPPEQGLQSAETREERNAPPVKPDRPVVEATSPEEGDIPEEQVGTEQKSGSVTNDSNSASASNAEATAGAKPAAPTPAPEPPAAPAPEPPAAPASQPPAAPAPEAPAAPAPEPPAAPAPQPPAAP
ncbi:MAG: TIGR02266 family protein, partial [Polyangiaceae bacterium]|nr:TIGR02266 family protein [Polyangiaceae bacterium]